MLIYSAGSFHLSPAETLDIQIARKVYGRKLLGGTSCHANIFALASGGDRKIIGIYLVLICTMYAGVFYSLRSTKTRTSRIHKIASARAFPRRSFMSQKCLRARYTPLIEEHIHQVMYRLPPGIPVITPDIVAKGVLKTVINRKNESVIPRRLSLAARLSSAFPSLLDTYYRRSIRGWTEGLKLGSKT